MYAVRKEIQGVDNTISEPVLLTVTKDLMKRLRINSEVKIKTSKDVNIDVVINGANGHSEHSSPRSELVEVSSVEDSESDNDLSLLVNRPDTYPFYTDKEIDTKFTAVNHRNTVTMTFKYYNKSKSAVTAMANKLKLMTSNDSMYNVHDITYHFNISPEIAKLLDVFNKIKNLREPDEAKKLQLDDYVNKTFDSRVDFINHSSGSFIKGNLGIRETQQGVLGNIVTELANIKTEKDDSLGMETVEFEYRFTYEKPVSILTVYPIMIYNKRIPKQFRITSKIEMLGMPMRGRRNQSSQGLYDFVYKDKDLPIIPFEKDFYLKIPKIDRFNLPQPLPYVARVFSTLTVVDDKDLTALFYLDEIDEVEFKDNVLKLIEKEHEYIGERYQSAFYIDIYNGGRQDYGNKVIVTPVVEEMGVDEETQQPIMKKRIKLTTEKPLSIKGSYRVAFNITTDFSVLSKLAKARLDESLAAVDEEIYVNQRDEFDARVAEGYVPLTTEDQFQWIIDSINVSRRGLSTDSKYVSTIAVDEDPSNNTRDDIIKEFKKFNINLGLNPTISQVVNTIELYPVLGTHSLLIKKVIKVLEYNGMFIRRPSTLNDIANTISADPKAFKNYDPREQLTQVSDIEAVLTENIHAKMFTKQFTMVISNIMQRK